MYLIVFFFITTSGSDKVYLGGAYKDDAAALFHLKNMGHMIAKLFGVSDIAKQFRGLAKDIEPLRKYF